MRCGRAQRWISARLDGELDARRRERVQAHLASCAPCRAFATYLNGLGEALDSASVGEPRWGFLNRVAARIAEVGPDAALPRLMRPAPVGVSLAAFCAGVALVLLANGETRSENGRRPDAMALLADSYLGTTTPAALEPEDELIDLLARSED